jgi:uncharacterized cupin superfamily protein
VKKILAATLLSLVAFGAYAEIRQHEEARPLASTALRHTEASFRPAPIPAAWVLKGEPVTEVADVSQTQDASTQVYLWRTTASTFRWTHQADEIITVLQGEVAITDGDGTTRSLGAGDVAHFPAGSTQTWDVPTFLLKSAVHKHRNRTVEAPMRWLRSLRQWVVG